MTDQQLPPKRRCPICTAPVGDRHGSSCRILAEVITDTSRGNATIRANVMPRDLEVAGCGCPDILVRNLGPQGGHDNTCLRTTWITPVTRPDRYARMTTPNDTFDQGLTVLWTACWTDNTVSRHGIHHPTHATAFQSRTGFDTWHAAAQFLDDLAATSRPIGVFLHASTPKGPTQ